jgi:hypothetical protein
VQIYMDPEDWAKLSELARMDDRSRSWLVRDLIHRALADFEADAPRGGMSALKKRAPLFPAAFRRQHPAANAFYAPQRERAPKVQHPKPRKVPA